MRLSLLAKRISAPAVVFCLTASVATANVGTGLSLDQYEAGTEVTNNTIVTNGGFENLTGGGQPVGWTLQNTFQVGAPVGPNTHNSGSRAAQGPLGAPDPTSPAFNGYLQNVTLAPNTNYVLSAYMWNFGLNFDLIVAEVRDNLGNFVSNIALTRNDDAGQGPPGNVLDGSRGVFGYTGFNSGAGGTFQLLVKWDTDEGVSGTRPSIAGQIDNVAITPASQFQPPRVPEPAGLALVAVATAALWRRR
ncbi:MAG: hypothetical protein NZ561_05720 [Phycisphaerae bacterium]|nr:hypothetical protein [Phycisphaerae bacterium]MDW8262364.1 hypothetical protein [Phycisphaerales bacterium]